MTPDERRPIILARARANPDGLTPYKFTKGMTKADALQFWNDAKALGLVVVGKSPRGAKILALPLTAGPGECDACYRRRLLYGAGPCTAHSTDVWAGAR